MPIGYIPPSGGSNEGSAVIPVNKFGFNNDVDSGASEDIMSFGGLYPFATFKTAQSLEVVSTSVADILTTGIGAWTISINGLDENKEDKTLKFNLNGATAVQLTGTWFAINRAFINDDETGTSGVNVGDLNIQVTGGGQIVSQIPASRGQTQQAVYRVPIDVDFRVTSLIAYTDASTGKTASMQLIRVGADCQTLRVLSSGSLTEASRWERVYAVGGKVITGGAWVAMRALSVAQDNTSITGDFDGVLE